MSQNPLMSSVADTIQGPQSRKATRFTPLDPIRLFRQYLWLWVIVVVLGVGLGVLVSFLCEKFIPRYTSTSTLLVSAELDDPYEDIIDPQGVYEKKDALTTFMLNQVLRMKSHQVLQRALERQDVKSTDWYKSFSHSLDAFDNLRDNLTVRVLRGSSLIEVYFSGPQADDMPRIVQAVNQSFLEQYRVDLLNRHSSLRMTMTREQTRAREDREEMQNELDAFLEEHDVPGLSSRGTETDIVYRALAERKILLEMALQQLQQGYNELLRQRRNPQINERPEISTAQDQDPRLAQRIYQMDQIRRTKMLLSHLGPNHRVMKSLDRDAMKLQADVARLRDELGRQSLQVAESGAQIQIERTMVELESLRDPLNEARERMRDLESTLAKYSEMAQRHWRIKEQLDRANNLLEELRVRETRPENVRITVQQQPTLAEMTFPRYVLMVPGVMLLVLALSISSVYLKELLDQRIKSPSDLELVPDANLLGVLPSTLEDPSGPVAVEGVVHKDPTGLIAEAFRQVRTEVLAKMDRRGYKTLVMVGAQEQCGTSVVVSNLATMMTFVQRKVLIIDANLRRPNQCQLFGIPTAPGLIEVLNGKVSLEEAIVHNEEPLVDVLPAGDGPPPPPEIFESETFSSLIASLEGTYDVVLIDAPPVLVASESKLLTKQVDAVAMVVRAKSGKRGMVNRMLRELEGQRADILGVILNGVHSSAGGYFRENYQAFYRYRHPNGARKGKRREVAEPVKS